MLIRDADTADWPLIWPFVHQIVSAGDTFTYDPELGEAEAEAMWMVDAPGRVVVAAADARRRRAARHVLPPVSETVPESAATVRPR